MHLKALYITTISLLRQYNSMKKSTHQVNINTESFKRGVFVSLMSFGSLHRQLYVSSKAVISQRNSVAFIKML